MSVVRTINEFLWGYPALFLLIGIHLYFTFRLGFVQKHVFHGIRLSIKSPEKDKHPARSKTGISGFSALMTTLAATIGTGNIIGMSTAVALGGPGAVFWCWVTGIFGMSTSYAECWLCHRFRRVGENGQLRGGPMYLLADNLKMPLAGALYAAAVIAASLFAGCAVQSNSIALAGKEAFHLPPECSGLLCAVLTTAVLIGGCRWIGRICSVLVPLMGVFYIVCCLVLLYLTRASVYPALKLILASAFSLKSLTGGVLGGGIAATLRYGIARGLFTNEAGMGSAGIMAAQADTEDSSRQALISMTGVFWDTVVMCGITGLVITAGFLEEPARILSSSAGELTLLAFSRLPWGEQLLGISLILFAVSTIIGWFFLGEQAYTFLSPKQKGLSVYKSLYLVILFTGAVMSIDVIWELTDLANLSLLLPNLYLLWRLRRHIKPPDSNAL